jgi:hypothetical protein
MFIPSVIKSIQRNTVTIAGSAASGSVAITAITLSSSIIKFLGYQTGYQNTGGRFSSEYKPRLELTSNVLVTAYRNSSASASPVTVSFEIIEFYPAFIKSIQRDTITLGSSTTSKAITAVTTAKSMLDHLGSSDDAANVTDDIPNGTEVALSLASSILVTGTMPGSGPPNTTTVGFQVCEFR